jgi:hypothetical protein
MARGWESKAVELQIESAEERNTRLTLIRLSAAEASFQREREGLELSRIRVMQDLASAENPKYRELLRRSLGFLDEKLAALDKSANKKLAHHA